MTNHEADDVMATNPTIDHLAEIREACSILAGIGAPDIAETIRRHADALAAEVARLTALTVPIGLSLRGAKDDVYPVEWRWKDDWDWHGAESVSEAIAEAERRKWRRRDS